MTATYWTEFVRLWIATFQILSHLKIDAMEQKLRRDRCIGDNLRKLRDKHNISQEKLKRELPVSGSVLYRWVSGKSLPTPTSLIRLSEYLDCSVDFLIGRRR